MDIKDLPSREIRIVCSGCHSEYYVPEEMMELKFSLELKCKKCNQLLEIRHHSLKEQMTKEMLEIIETSTYRFLDLPPIRHVVEKMEEEDE